jgi:hypothetical protein
VRARYRSGRAPVEAPSPRPLPCDRCGKLTLAIVATLAEQKRLTRHLLARGQRPFNLSYHSPSLLPGSTPHVRDEAQPDQFIEMLEAYIVWFASEPGDCFTTPLEVKALLEADQA